MTKLKPRNLDHVVLPVPSLDISRDRFTDLGFKVAPDARHKFGTENACIFFRNGTFIEPLAIGHHETVEAAIKKGNPFLRRDKAYRFRNGNDGFTMVVFGDPDPKKQRKAIREAGWETGKLVTVRRPGVKVRVALGIDERSPDCSTFLCERPDGPPEFQAELTQHKNRALGLVNVTLYEDEPREFQSYLQTMSGQSEVEFHESGMEIDLPNATLSVLNKDGMMARFELIPDRGRGMRAVAFDVAVPNLEDVSAHLNSSGIETRKVGERLIVDPAPGQGAVVAFVEAQS